MLRKEVLENGLRIGLIAVLVWWLLRQSEARARVVQARREAQLEELERKQEGYDRTIDLIRGMRNDQSEGRREGRTTGTESS
jgi:hypothetical protein